MKNNDLTSRYQIRRNAKGQQNLYRAHTDGTWTLVAKSGSPRFDQVVNLAKKGYCELESAN
jgi:hypothetical protein